MNRQLTLAIRAGPRAPHPTGLQVPCAPCRADGLDRLGMPRLDTSRSDPLCIPHYRAQQRADVAKGRRDLRAALWEGLGAAEEAAECAACGSDLPSPECWLCGWSWLAEHDQAEAEMAAADVEHRFAQMAEILVAEQLVDQLHAWLTRALATVEGYHRGGGRGRAVWLLADAIARAPERGSRGPAGVWPEVAAVLALDACWRSGRQARPGRNATAALVGVTEQTVTRSWRLLEEMGWATRTGEGRLATLAERRELGTHRIRAAFDVEALQHRPSGSVSACTAEALRVYARLIERVTGQLAAAQEALEALRGDVPAWTDRVRRVQLAAAATQAQEKLVALPEGSPGRRSSSGSYLGLGFCRVESSRTLPGHGPGSAGGERRPSGSPTSGGARSRRLTHPRTADGLRRRLRARSRPGWADWAPEIARDLQKRWVWLAGTPMARVAATLGARLGPDWTAEALVGWVARRRAGRQMLDDPAAPLAYLRTVLDQAFDGSVEPPAPAARHTAIVRECSAAAAYEVAERMAARRAVAGWPARSTSAPADLDWPEVARPGGGSDHHEVTQSADGGTQSHDDHQSGCVGGPPSGG